MPSVKNISVCLSPLRYQLQRDNVVTPLFSLTAQCTMSKKCAIISFAMKL